MKEVRIAIVGLGRVGSVFLQKLTELDGGGVKIIGVVEVKPDAPGLKVASDKNIRVYKDIQDLVRLGDGVDVIFELSGSPEVRRALRSGLAASNNRHTVVAPEVVAFLIWNLIASGEVFPESHADKGY